jgi:hypothetical protein
MEHTPVLNSYELKVSLLIVTGLLVINILAMFAVTIVSEWHNLNELSTGMGGTSPAKPIPFWTKVQISCSTAWDQRCWPWTRTGSMTHTSSAHPGSHRHGF